MAAAREFVVKLADGPYEVDRTSGPLVAERMRIRHFRTAELWVAREFVRRAVLPGTYYFDVYLLTDDALDWMLRKPENLWSMAVPYMHRIDAVCWQPGAVWILEFKWRLNYSAIGQVLGYRDFFVREYHPDRLTKLMIVATTDRRELHRTLEKEGIELQIIK